MTHRRIGAILMMGLAAFAMPPALAQTPPTPDGKPDIQAGEIHWFGVPARCTYFTYEQQAAFRQSEPETWRFTLVTMRATTKTDGKEPLERAYVSVDGLLRELEKVRSGADSSQNQVTVWRSAGEPRINVTMTLAAAGEGAYQGRMTLVRGNGETETEISGRCID